MNSVLESKNDVQQVAGESADVGKATISLLRRFHFGEPAAAKQTTLPEPTVLGMARQSTFKRKLSKSMKKDCISAKYMMQRWAT